MTLSATPNRLEALAEAMLSVAPGPFGMTRLVLRHVGLFAVVALAFRGIGYVVQAELDLHAGDQDMGAELLLVVVVASFVGGLLGLFFGRVFNNSASWHVAEQPAPSAEVAAAWWVSWALLGLVILLAFLAYQFFFAKGGSSTNAIDVSATLFPLLFLILALAILQGGSWLVQRVRPFFAASPRLWALACAMTWIWDLGIACGWLFGVALVVNKVLSLLGIEAWLTPASIIGGVLFAGLLAFFDVVGIWFRRLEFHHPATASAPRTDYWEIDLAPETSYSGKSPKGYPFYVWRESADSRLGMSRPRHCCLVESNQELNFVFFDPSDNRQPTLAFLFGGGIGIAVVLAMAVMGWLGGKSISFWGALSAIFAAMLIGTVAGLIWHLGLIVARWKFGRFAGDGRVTFKPLRLLTGFNTVHAGEVGAKIDGVDARSGHGLTAVFEDGSMIILTGNAWNYRSIVEHHAELTNAFCVPRDDYLMQWRLARQEKEKRTQNETLPRPATPQPAPPPPPTPPVDGVPNAL